MKKPTIAVLGGINVDLVIRCSSLPKPGETVKGISYSHFPGGKGANQAVAAAKLGGKVVMLGAVGTDEFGTDLIRGMGDISIDNSHVKRVAEFPTGTAFIIVDEKGQNLISFVGGANDTIDEALIDNAEQDIKKADVFLVQLECPVNIVEYGIKKAASLDVPVIFNPAPAVPLSDGIIACCEAVMPNESEAEALTGCKVCDTKSAQRAAHLLVEMGCKAAIITLGENGAYLYKPDCYDEIIPAPEVNAVDAVAAGDVFAGAFSVRFGIGDNLRNAVIYANKAAAISTTRNGAQTSIPEAEMIK